MRLSSALILIVIVLVSALTPVQLSLQLNDHEGTEVLVFLNVCHSSTEVFSGPLEMPAVISCSCVPPIPAPAGVVAVSAQLFEPSLVIQQHDRPPQA